MLNNKNIRILSEIIQCNGENSIKKLADTFGVTERSIRYDIEVINEFLEANNLDSINKEKKGELLLNNFQVVRNILLDKFTLEYLSNEKRIEFILIKLLFDSHINLNRLTEEFDISRSTIRNYMVEVRATLEKYNLAIEAKGNIGLEIVGEEDNIRRCILNLIIHIDMGESIEASYIRREVDKYFDIELNHIYTFINYIQKKLDKLISDEAFNTIAYYISIAIFRNYTGNKLKTIRNKQFIEGTEEFEAIKGAIVLLEANYDMQFSQEEIGKISELVIGSHSYNFTESYFENWIELEIRVKEMINRVSNRVEVDLSRDKDLLMGLINHIQPTLYRIRNKIQLQNSIYKEVYETYENLYRIVEETVIDFEEFLDIKFSNDELAYLVVHFKGAIDRNSFDQKEKTNLLIVCNFGYGSSKLLAQKIKDNFNVNIVDIIPKYLLKKKNIDFDSIDFIVSTIELSGDYPVPKILVSPMLNKKDIEIMEKLAIGKNKKKVLLSDLLGVVEQNTKVEDRDKLVEDLLKFMPDKIYNDLEKREYSLRDLLNRDNIEVGVEVSTWQEALKYSGNELIKQGAVDESYIDQMIGVIHKYGSYIIIDDMIAIPHARSEGSVAKTAMALVVLKEAVEFPDGKKVRILLPFSSIDNKEHLKALVEFATIIGEDGFKREIKKEKVESRKLLTLINKDFESY